MKAGDLRHKITIEAPTFTSNDAGETITTWPDDLTDDQLAALTQDQRDALRLECWAAIWPISAKERLLNNDVSEVASHRIKIRYRESVTSDKRIIFGGRVFQIESVITPEERNIELTILASEQRPGVNG
jgi:SPP1 family predicted phage head-tail adaptor